MARSVVELHTFVCRRCRKTVVCDCVYAVDMTTGQPFEPRHGPRLPDDLCFECGGPFEPRN